MLLISKILSTYNSTDEEAEMPLCHSNLEESNILYLDISKFMVEYLLDNFLTQSITKNSYEISSFFKLAKMGYSILLLQIAARVIYEQNGYFLKDWKASLILSALEEMIRKQNADLTLSGLPIETSRRFIEGSLPYLRKVAATLNLLLSKENSKGNRMFKL